MDIIKPVKQSPIAGMAGFSGGPTQVVLDYGQGPPIPKQKWTVDPTETNRNNETQTYTVPKSGDYTFILFGAGGSAMYSHIGTDSSKSRGGWSAPVKGTITLTEGDQLEIGIGMQHDPTEVLGSQNAMNQPGNSSSYVMRGGAGSTGAKGGAGGGGTYIKTISVTGTLPNYNGYLMVSGGGGGGPGHAFSNAMGGAGGNESHDGGAYNSNYGNYSDTGDRYPSGGFASGQLVGGSDTRSDAQGVGGGGGGAGGGQNGTSCTHGHSGSQRGQILSASSGTLTSPNPEGGQGGGGHSNCCSGGGGGGGNMSFTAYSSNAEVYQWNSNSAHRDYTRLNYDKNTATSNHNFSSVITEIENAGLTYNWEGAGGGSDTNGAATFLRTHGAVFLIATPA